jgi:hypothetical protein
LDGPLKSCRRPLIIACDEYGEVASEVPGQIGDGDFFSQARQFGCMGLLATQSVNVLQASSLKDAWRSVFSTFGAKIYAGCGQRNVRNNEMSGEYDWYKTSVGMRSKDD